MQRDTRGDEGFTLIELLIVIVVLGILAGIVVLALSAVTSQSAVAACNADAATVEAAASAYTAQTGGTPTVSALTTGNAPYLHSFPSATNPNYVITLVNGTVMIAAPPSNTPVAYGTANACSGAGTPGSTPVANGVTATPTTNTYGGYGGQDIVTLSNTQAISALTITINVAQTTGVSTNGGYNSFPGGAGNAAWSTGSGVFTYTYTLTSGQIPAGYSNGQLAAQYSGTGSARVTTGDTWSVTSTTSAGTSTLSGHF